jgi:hypothetical protein
MSFISQSKNIYTEFLLEKAVNQKSAGEAKLWQFAVIPSQ